MAWILNNNTLDFRCRQAFPCANYQHCRQRQPTDAQQPDPPVLGADFIRDQLFGGIARIQQPPDIYTRGNSAARGLLDCRDASTMPKATAAPLEELVERRT